MTDQNRSGSIVNMPNSVNTPMYVEALLIIGSVVNEYSPQFMQPPTFNRFSIAPCNHNVTAFDHEGDCLTYELVDCKMGAGQPVPGYYLPIGVTIDPMNGEITWKKSPNSSQQNSLDHIYLSDWVNLKFDQELGQSDHSSLM